METELRRVLEMLIHEHKPLIIAVTPRDSKARQNKNDIYWILEELLTHLSTKNVFTVLFV